MIPNSETAAAVWRPNVTVATVVPREGRFLFVEETIRGRLMLNQPAGHLEPDETLFHAALRETVEETGWSVELTDLIGIYQWADASRATQFLRFTFAAAPLAHDPQRLLDEGIVQALWLTRAEVAAQQSRLRSPMVLGNVDAWLAGRRYPLSAIESLLPSVAAGA